MEGLWGVDHATSHGVRTTWKVHYDVDLSINAFLELGWSHYFDRKTLNKLNIVQVNRVWQHGRVNQDDGQDDQNPLIIDDHVEDIVPQP